jgi:hypothetical protein
MPERDGDQLIERVGADLALAPGQGPEDRRPDQRVRGQRGGADPGHRGGQRGDGPAQGPGQREPEQQVGQHEVRRHADEQPGAQGPGHLAAGALRPHQSQPEQGRAGRQHVQVPARHQRPQQQRVHRPQQVRAGPAGRVRPQQPVQAERHAEVRDPVPQLQPEDDRDRRGAAQPRRPQLLGGGQRAVERRVPAPGQVGQVADRIPGLVQLNRSHHVRVVAEQGHPAVGGVADRVGGARGRQDRQHHDGADRHREQQPGGIARPARDRDQPGGHACAAENRTRPQAERHRHVRQGQRQLHRQRPGRGGHHRNRQARAGSRGHDDDQDREADAGGGQPAQ